MESGTLYANSTSMNCNECGMKTIPRDRLEPSFDSKMKTVQKQKQKMRLSSFVFFLSFSTIYCIVTLVINGDGVSFSNWLVADALIAPKVAIRHGHRNVARVRVERTSRIDTRRKNQRQENTALNQQSSNGVEIDEGNSKDRMQGATILTPRSGAKIDYNPSRRCFLTISGATTSAVAVNLMLSPSDCVASASLVDGENEETLAAHNARVFEYTEENNTATTIPLAFTGQELLVAYKVDGSKFKAVLDTGSPFLMIPGSCGSNTRQKSGCYQNQGTPVPKLTPTIEIFDGFEGEVNWRSAPFEFWDVNNNESINYTSSEGASDSMSPDQTKQKKPEDSFASETPNAINKITDKKRVIFGVASEDIMGGPGGVFFGMIRDTDARIRPSFLGQTDVQAFRVDLAARPRTLTLSNQDLVATGGSSGQDGKTFEGDYIPMTNLLRRRYGDPVGHYTALAQSIYVDGYPLVDTTIEKNSKILVIFDTGVTGMVVSRGLFDEQYILARKQRQKRLFGDVELSFSTALGKVTTLSATKPLATPFDPEKTWKKFPKRREGKKSNTHIIVMGLAFLEGRSLTVDIDKERLWVE